MPPPPKPPLPGGSYLKTIDEDKSDVASTVNGPGMGHLKRPARIGSDEGANSVLAETGGARPHAARDQRFTATPRNTAIVAVVAVIGIAVTVAVIVLLAGGSGSDNDTESAFDRAIASVSSDTILKGGTTPQGKARNWMLEEDTLLETIASDEDRIRQRYALSVLFFSTNGGMWEHANESIPVVFLDPTLNECNWTGVVCESEVPMSNLRRRQQRRAQETKPRYNFDPVVQLVLKNLKLSGPLPSEIGAIQTLRKVDLSNNTIVGSLPDVFENLPDLDYLDASENNITGSIPTAVWSHKELRYLYLYANELSGRIEGNGPDRNNEKTLKEIRIYQNKLSGQLPDWLARLFDLEQFIAFENQFSGTLPQLYPDTLKDYDLSFNRITGRIPESLWSVQGAPPLEKLYLDHNLLTGPLPPSPNPRPLQIVWLHENKNLNGTIPENFAQEWSRLKELKLEKTEVTGVLGPQLGEFPVPDETVAVACPQIWPSLVKMTANCSYFYVGVIPPVDCDCCTECFESE